MTLQLLGLAGKLSGRFRKCLIWGLANIKEMLMGVEFAGRNG